MVADRLSRSCFNVLYPFCVSSIHPKTAGGAQNHYGFLEEIDGHPNGGSYSRRGWGKTYPQQTGAASGLKSRSTWMGLPVFLTLWAAVALQSNPGRLARGPFIVLKSVLPSNTSRQPVFTTSTAAP
jgi:hypothetical protein